MKNIINSPKIKQDLASDLVKFARVLDQYEICRNHYTILNAAEMLRKSGNKNWSYTINDLIFECYDNEIPQNTKPEKINLLEITLNLSVEAKYNNKKTIVDPFIKLDFNLIIKGKIINDNKIYFSCYHLDRHINGENNNSSTFHPQYHFHYGGRNMNYEINNYDQLLLLSAPRIPHYPMELILGVDFILANFFHKKREKLKEVPEYINLVINYRNNYCKSYIRTLNELWKNDPDIPIEWDPKLLWLLD